MAMQIQKSWTRMFILSSWLVSSSTCNTTSSRYVETEQIFVGVLSKAIRRVLAEKLDEMKIELVDVDIVRFCEGPCEPSTSPGNVVELQVQNKYGIVRGVGVEFQTLFEQTIEMTPQQVENYHSNTVNHTQIQGNKTATADLTDSSSSSSDIQVIEDFTGLSAPNKIQSTENLDSASQNDGLLALFPATNSQENAQTIFSDLAAVLDDDPNSSFSVDSSSLKVSESNATINIEPVDTTTKSAFQSVEGFDLGSFSILTNLDFAKTKP